jgi:hypothetical protein
MGVEVRQESAGHLNEYAWVPIAFDVSEIFDVGAAPDQQFAPSARQIAVPYVKD